MGGCMSSISPSSSSNDPILPPPLSKSTAATAAPPPPPSPPPHQPQIIDENDEYQYWLSKIEESEGDWTTALVLRDAPYHIHNNKKIVMAAVRKGGKSLQYASPSLQNDKDVLAMAAEQENRARKDAIPIDVKDETSALTIPSLVPRLDDQLQYLMDECSLEDLESVCEDDEYQYWLSKVKSNGCALMEAPQHIKNNKNIFLSAVKESGYALRYAPKKIKNNKYVVIAAVQEDGVSLEYASPSLQNDKQVVIAAVQKDGSALEYASPSLQNDKQIALLAVKQNPDIIKYIHEDLKRDPDILIAACMFDGDHQDAVARRQQSPNTRKIVLSTRFSLDPNSKSEATNFTAKFKNSFYIQRTGDFIVYAPNAFDKKTCDPEWTRFDWPCRGTANTCKYKNKLTPDGHPTDDCCWRYSFRSQLQEAKDTQGFMLQLVETEPSVEHGKVKDARLGMGQRIELDMANTIGTKVFQVYRPSEVDLEIDVDFEILDDYYDGVERWFEVHHIIVVVNEISRWYDNQCQDMSVTTIRQPYNDYGFKHKIRQNYVRNDSPILDDVYF